MMDDNSIVAKKAKDPSSMPEPQIEEPVDVAQREKEEEELFKKKVEEMQAEVYRRRQLIIKDVCRKKNVEYNWGKSIAQQLHDLS
uniref:Cwf21 domain-containing protein n=1 Tax=Steinernema glaseri TaxID=37863 RepID=A0A1I7XXU5_9BILA